MNQAFIAWSFVVAKISTVSEYFARYSEVLGNGFPGRESKSVRDYNNSGLESMLTFRWICYFDEMSIFNVNDS